MTYNPATKFFDVKTEDIDTGIQVALKCLKGQNTIPSKKVSSKIPQKHW